MARLVVEVPEKGIDKSKTRHLLLSDCRNVQDVNRYSYDPHLDLKFARLLYCVLEVRRRTCECKNLGSRALRLKEIRREVSRVTRVPDCSQKLATVL